MVYLRSVLLCRGWHLPLRMLPPIFLEVVLTESQGFDTGIATTSEFHRLICA
jgi:hypothetical protein